MFSLPKIDSFFPKNTAWSLFLFWLKYWLCFFLFLPFMFLRQIFISTLHLCEALLTWNKSASFLKGDLVIIYQNNLSSLIATILFGERFLFTQYRDIIIDPGPRFARKHILNQLKKVPPKTIRAVAVTHFHEEHIGNASSVASFFKVPIYGSKKSLQSIKKPEKLSFMRKTMMGQPLASRDLEMLEVQSQLKTKRNRLLAIESPGHCEGHLSYYDPENKILFAGDSFLHEIFTAPNADVNSHQWIETLQKYKELDIEIMIGSHGYLTSIQDKITKKLFVVESKDPNTLISNKIQFIQWARKLVAEGERRQLSYGVIEACLFPWHRSWSWKNWFNDESFRLFTAGEFSRTHFVRSLSTSPEKVPPRFRRLAKIFSPEFKNYSSKKSGEKS